MAIVPQTFDDVFRFSQVLSRSGLVPYGMNTAEKVSVAILTGLELGIKPMQAVQGIAVINGAPRIWGDLALGLVRASGLLEEFSETYEGTPPVDWEKPKGDELQFKAICRVKRKGEAAVISEFSIADAMTAKLWQKKGGQNNDKDTPWVTNPKRMMKMRARGFSLRDTFTDVLKGMTLAEEMIGDDVDDADFRPAPDRGPPPPPPAPDAEDATIISETAAGAIPPGQPAAQDVGASLGNPAENAPASAEDQGELIDPNDILANLIDMLALAKDAATIEEGYAHLDVEAELAGFEGYVEKAREVKASHLARVEKLAAGTAGQCAEAGAPPPPPMDDDIPAGNAERVINTAADYETVLTEKLTAATNVDEYEVVRAWWGTTRPQRHALGITEHADIARLQDLFKTCKTRLGI
ncbi:recombinase RecT [Bosea sp. 2KB_26]|uniref:recombinase RecT n=1 Tax=Bosea sp. 2KB_26 TaxID=3237475 RepID=UPI003F8FB66B